MEKDRRDFNMRCGQYNEILGSSSVYSLERQSFEEVSKFCRDFNAEYDLAKGGKFMDVNDFVQKLFDVLVFQSLYSSLNHYLDEILTPKFETLVFFLVFFLGFFWTMALNNRPIGAWFWLMGMIFSTQWFWEHGPTVL